MPMVRMPPRRPASTPARCAPPIPRCCTTARAASSSTGPAGRGQRSAARRAARARRGHRGADRRRAAQGVRPPRPAHHPADLDDRLPPAARGRGGVLHRRGRQARAPQRRGRPTRSRSAVSATRPPTTPPRSVPSTPPIHAAYQGLPLPLLFVCEDNGIGISTKTPTGWIAPTTGTAHGLRYFERRRLRPAGRLRRRRRRRRVGARRTASRRSCTCTRCG